MLQNNSKKLLQMFSPLLFIIAIAPSTSVAQSRVAGNKTEQLILKSIPKHVSPERVRRAFKTDDQLGMGSYLERVMRESEEPQKYTPKPPPKNQQIIDIRGRSVPPIHVPSQEKPVLSLIVNFNPDGHLRESLSRMRAVESAQNIKLGQVVMLGYRAQEHKDFNKQAKKLIKRGIPKNPKEYRELVEKNQAKQNAAKAKLPPEIKKLIDDLQGTDPLRAKAARKKLLYRNYSAGTKIYFDYGTKAMQDIDSHYLLARYNITHSPAWIVRYQGHDHVFEGLYDPAELFDSRGTFLRHSGAQTLINNGKAFYNTARVSLSKDNVLILKHKRRPSNHPAKPSMKYPLDALFGFK